MTKSELIDSIAKIQQVTKKQATEILDFIVSEITGALRDGGDVTLPGLGVFKIKATAARTGRNPQTGAPVDIPAGKKISFKAHKQLREAIAL